MRISRLWTLLLLLALGAAALSGCADAPRIWFENQRDDRVSVSIDGDRLVILQPHSGQFLPYSTAAWAWPRRMAIATAGGAPLWSEDLDADGLAQRHWLVYIRPE